MPNSFAFSSAAAAAILAASRESVGRLFVADMLMDARFVAVTQWISVASIDGFQCILAASAEAQKLTRRDRVRHN